MLLFEINQQRGGVIQRECKAALPPETPSRKVKRKKVSI